MKVFEVGGQEMVTNVLATKFINEEHNVTIVSFNKPSQYMLENLDSRISFHTLDGYSSKRENIKKLRSIFIANNISIVINQWGLPYIPIKVAKVAGKHLSIKYISVYHNNPSTNARLESINIELQKTKSKINRLILNAKKAAFTFVTRNSMRLVYKNSNEYILLSNSYIDSFKRFTGLKNLSKINVIANPVTIDNKNFEYKFGNKNKEIIYVGRIDYNQKRVHRVISTWALLEDQFPDWNLVIVGDGSERKNIELLVNEKALKNVSFEGFKDPIEYYKRASILMLTSEYEGFPLVLAECMSFGVIPFVYGSYPAVYDIITTNVNGVIIPPVNKSFKADLMAEKLSEIMIDDNKRLEMSKEAIAKSKNYSLHAIYKSWLDLFRNV